MSPARARGEAAEPVRLRLRAEDAEDLAVISACLQDALVSVRDLAYDRDGRVFLAMANRFRWEDCEIGPEKPSKMERILCGIAFEDVEDVAYRGFQRSEEERILSLLALQPVRGPVGAMIDLEFAAGATIRLHAARIRVRVHDFGEPWLTARQPDHPFDPA